MSDVLLGTNRFEGCETLLAYRDVPVLAVAVTESGLMLDLHMPEGARALTIERNQKISGDASVWTALGFVSVIVDQTLVVHAVRTGEDEVLVDLDLRPLGADVYTDAAGLHIGGNVLARNVVQGARVAVVLS